MGFSDDDYPDLSHDQLRRRRRREVLEAELGDAAGEGDMAPPTLDDRPPRPIERPAATVDPLALLLVAEDRREFWNAVDRRIFERKLTDQERASYLLVEFHGLSQEQISMVLGRTARMVRHYLAGARRKLETAE